MGHLNSVVKGILSLHVLSQIPKRTRCDRGGGGGGKLKINELFVGSGEGRIQKIFFLKMHAISRKVPVLIVVASFMVCPLAGERWNKMTSGSELFSNKGLGVAGGAEVPEPEEAELAHSGPGEMESEGVDVAELERAGCYSGALLHDGVRGLLA